MTFYEYIKHTCRRNSKNILAMIVTLTFIASFAVYKSIPQHIIYPHELVCIDSLCDTNPDSAQILINNISPKDLSVEQSWYFRFLKIKQKIKSGNTTYDIMEINKIEEYFCNKKAKELLPQVYYYAGCAYFAMDDIPLSMECFHKAIEACENTDKAESTKALCYYMLGHVLSMQGLDKEAIPWQEKSLYLHLKNKNTERCIYDYENLAWSNYNIGNKKASLASLNKAWILSQNLNDCYIISEVASQYATIYKNEGLHDKAEYYIEIALRNPQKQSISPIYSIALEIYSKLGDVDKAKSFCDSVMKYGNVYGKEYAYLWLTKENIKKGNTLSATSYFSKYLLYKDSVELKAPLQASANANAMYNYAIREKENADLEKENTKQKINIIIITLSSIIIFLLIALAYYILWKSKKKLEDRLQLMRNSLEKAKMLEKDTLKDKEHELEEIKEKLSSLIGNEHEERKLLEENANACENTLAIITHTIQEKRLFDNKMSSTDVYKKIKQILSTNSNERFQEWELLANTVYSIYPSFKENIHKFKKMSDIEINVCILIKIGISIPQISKLVCRSKDSVYSICRRLYQKNLEGKASAK